MSTFALGVIPSVTGYAAQRSGKDEDMSEHTDGRNVEL